MAIPFLTGQRLTADLMNANIGDFFPQTFTKTAATSRSSTTTVTDDPELQAIPLSVGTWEIEFVGMFACPVTASSQGIRTRWGFTGTWVGGTIRACWGGNGAVLPSASTPINTTGYQLTQDALYNTSSTSPFAGIREISRTVVVSVAGNFSIQWAQQTSNAAAVDLKATSHVNIRKIS